MAPGVRRVIALQALAAWAEPMATRARGHPIRQRVEVEIPYRRKLIGSRSCSRAFAFKEELLIAAPFFQACKHPPI